MMIKFLKNFLPPIFVMGIRKLLSTNPNKLFNGDHDLFKDEVKKVDVYGEYGCGQSTKWVLSNTVADVIAVDTSIEWVDAVKKDNESNNDRLNIGHVNLGDVGE